MQNGNYLDGEKITFTEFTQKWLDNYAKIKLTPATFVSYKTKLFTYTQAKNLSEKTIRNYMGVICVILSTAVKWNIIKDNPALRVDYKKIKKPNLPKITFHQLRHTNASLLISSGEDVVTVSGRLGHSDKNITLNTYSHIIKSKEMQAANKMDEFYSSLSLRTKNAG